METRTFLSSYTVNSLADDGSGGTGGVVTLRSAIEQADANPSDTTTIINFDPSLFSSGSQAITLTNGPLEFQAVDQTVDIQGPGAKLLSIDGGGGTAILVYGGSVPADNARVAIVGVTITDAAPGISDGGFLSVTDSEITDNSVGAFVDYNAALWVVDSTISGNTGGEGAGIASAQFAQVNVISSTITGNSAAYVGGGIYRYGYEYGSEGEYGNLTISNSTVAGNTGGSWSDEGVSSLGSFTMNNSIVAGNDGDPSVGSVDSNHNLIGGDPMLAPLGDYGGPTQTMPLLPGSPALGAGTSISGIFTDQRGMALPTDSAPDIGAVQTQVGTLTVNTAQNDPVGSGQMSFSDATNLANLYGDNQTIDVDPSIITHSGGTFSVGNVFSVTAPATIDEGSDDTLRFVSGSSLNVLAWSVAWTDQGNNPLTTDTVNGPTATDTYPDVETPGLVATVTAIGSSGNSYALPAFVATTIPTAPSGFGISSFSTNAVSFAWTNESVAATQVDVLASTDGTTYSVIGSVPATESTYTATGLSEGTWYGFEAESVLSGVPPLASGAVFITTAATAQPEDLSAVAVSSTEIDLSWPAYSPAGAGATNIFASTNGTDFSYFDSVGSGTTTYQALGLEPNNSYTFEVTAYDSSHDHFAPSNEASASTFADPWSMQATGPATDDEGDVYQLDLSVNPSPSAPAFGIFSVDWGDGSAISTYTLDELPATHTFLTGIDSSAIDVTASTASGITPSLTVTANPVEVDMIPAAPTDLSVSSPSPTEADLNWTDNSQDADGYEILRLLDGDSAYVSIAQVAGTEDSYIDSTLSAGESAAYMIEATGASATDTSAPATSSPVTTPLVPPTPTGMPSLSVSPSASSPTSATLTWTYADTDDSGFEIEVLDEQLSDNYQLLVAPGPVDATGTGTTTINNLVVGDTYDFRMRADHIGGTASHYTVPVLLQLGAGPAPHLTVYNTDLAGVFPSSGGNIRVGWTGVPDDDSVQLEVQGDPYAGQAWHAVTFGNEPSFSGWPATSFGSDYSIGADYSQDADPSLEGYINDPECVGPGFFMYRIRSVDPDGSVSAWSQPQGANYYGGGTAGPTPQLTATSTTITVTWTAVDPLYHDERAVDSLFLQEANQPYPVNAWDGDGRVWSGVGYPQPGGNSVTFTETLTDLTPGKQYEISLWSTFQNEDDDETSIGFSKAAITTDGVTPATPAAPDKAWAVDLGDGVSNAANVELIWHNTPDNEDGFIVEETDTWSDPFGWKTYRVGADQTNFINAQPNMPKSGGTLIYRVASFIGDVQSAWVYVDITPFRSPTAMSIGWIPGGGSYTPFNWTSNNPPPGSFSDDAAFENWEALHDFRFILGVQVGITIDPYTGRISQAKAAVQKYAGYTPGFGLGMKGQSPDYVSSGPIFNSDHTRVTIIVLQKAIVNGFENFGYGVTQGWQYPDGNHFTHMLAWAWTEIAYTIDISGSAGAVFTGSLVPSQTDYWNYSEVGGYSMVPNITPFLSAPAGGLLGPSSNVTVTAGN